MKPTEKYLKLAREVELLETREEGKGAELIATHVAEKTKELVEALEKANKWIVHPNHIEHLPSYNPDTDTAEAFNEDYRTVLRLINKHKQRNGGE